MRENSKQIWEILGIEPRISSSTAAPKQTEVHLLPKMKAEQEQRKEYHLLQLSVDGRILVLYSSLLFPQFEESFFYNLQ